MYGGGLKTGSQCSTSEAQIILIIIPRFDHLSHQFKAWQVFFCVSQPQRFKKQLNTKFILLTCGLLTGCRLSSVTRLKPVFLSRSSCWWFCHLSDVSLDPFKAGSHCFTPTTYWRSHRVNARVNGVELLFDRPTTSWSDRVLCCLKCCLRAESSCDVIPITWIQTKCAESIQPREKAHRPPAEETAATINSTSDSGRPSTVQWTDRYWR